MTTHAITASLTGETASIHIDGPSFERSASLYITRRAFASLIDFLSEQHATKATGALPLPDTAVIAWGDTDAAGNFNLTFHSGGSLGMYVRRCFTRKELGDLVDAWSALDAAEPDNDAHRNILDAP